MTRIAQHHEPAKKQEWNAVGDQMIEAAVQEWREEAEKAGQGRIAEHLRTMLVASGETQILWRDGWGHPSPFIQVFYSRLLQRLPPNQTVALDQLIHPIQIRHYLNRGILAEGTREQVEQSARDLGRLIKLYLQRHLIAP